MEFNVTKRLHSPHESQSSVKKQRRVKRKKDTTPIPESNSNTMEARFTQAGCAIVMSSPQAWQQLREGRPQRVGIDTEGIQMTPPLLVQVAYRDARSGKVVVILEAPRGGRLSPDMVALLGDESVTKVFCAAGGDTDALGVPCRNLADVQAIAAERQLSQQRAQQKAAATHSSTSEDAAPPPPLQPLGLGSLGSKYVFGGDPVLKNKGGWKFFAFMKQRPTDLSWPSGNARLCKYAAADAWMTLAIYENMIKVKLLKSKLLKAELKKKRKEKKVGVKKREAGLSKSSLSSKQGAKSASSKVEGKKKEG
eukprot:CAMPEP_0171933554 /NCGR_PEP_ID=MMETSP0993-20121228/31357_1 /TAXON_ID=483369 /ORGANISM="non described non described, Strain CCMP2098" /LENGTH=307 /DNA_ID=CAMNT_0012574103 /DNA_START=17 /DNA_END=940 /DNA_ORIENTATION=+